jgi:RNA ligase
MEEIPTALIPNEPFEVFEKMDGSLGICFKYKGEFVLATRGSFTSDQSKKGTEIAKKYGIDHAIVEGFTYLFEIIYPENRIVVDYQGQERLVLLGIIKTDTGEEIPYDELASFEGWGTMLVQKYDGINDYKTLKALVKDDQEGFIVRFKSGFRMKVKGAEYVRLHRLLTNFSNIDIWEVLKRGDNINTMLERVPDEFDAWVRKTVEQLTSKFILEKAKHEKEFWTLIDRKQFAEMVKDRPDKHFMFRRLSSYSKIYDEMIWESIRPTYQKPFWNKEDEE